MEVEIHCIVCKKVWCIDLPIKIDFLRVMALDYCDRCKRNILLQYESQIYKKSTLRIES